MMKQQLINEFQERQNKEILDKLTLSEISEEVNNILKRLKSKIILPEDKVYTSEHLDLIQKEVKNLQGKELMLLEIFISVSILVYLPEYLVAALLSILSHSIYKDTDLKSHQLVTAYFLDYVNSGKGKFLFGKIIYDAIQAELTKEMITLMLIGLIEDTKKEKEYWN